VRVAPYTKAANTPACLEKLRDEVGRLLIKRHTQVMRLFKSWLLAMIIFVWVVAFLSLLATGLEVPTALTTAHSPHVNQETNGDWHPLEAIYLAVPAEEVDKHPVNADLLSALLLLAVSFGAIVVWSLANGWWHRAFRFVGLGRSFLSTLEDRSFLGVFRL
jgi:hypothetical protein